MEENNFPKDNRPGSKETEKDFDSDDSADSSDAEKCPICLLAFSSNQEIGKPAVCDHVFCFPCLQEWSKVVQTCPIDRSEFQEIRVFDNLECNNLIRTVQVKDKITLEEFINDEEVTACEICSNFDREESMLLCDGCDKGFHMFCLDPPLTEIPQDNWFCDDCFETSDDEDDTEELLDLNNDIETEMGSFTGSRLRTRQQQPQILRTMQSERIRNAILSRMSLRSARQAFGEGPSTSSSVAYQAKPANKRRVTRRRKATKRTRTRVVEYDVDGSDKFAMKTRKVGRRGRKKVRVSKNTRKRVVKETAGPSTSFKTSNANVHELQRGRSLAGLSNFNIFEPTNLLDYVPDEDDVIDDSGIDDGAEVSFGNVIIQGTTGLRNHLRRNMIIKNRVLQNCTATSSSNLLDTIMQDQSMFGPGSIRNKFAVEKSSGKLLFVGSNAGKLKQATGSDENQASGNVQRDQPCENSTHQTNATDQPTSIESSIIPSNTTQPAPSDNSGEQPNEIILTPMVETHSEDKKKKQKKPEIDMFDENSVQAEEETCPNFSIYDSVGATFDQDASSSFQMRPNVYDEENVDLIQMSDNEQQNDSSGELTAAIIASQPASPDVEHEKINEELQERSYTPPIPQKTCDDAPNKDEFEKKKRDRESRQSRKRELERYNVRDRLKDRSPIKVKDKFGRNRSRTRSSSRRKHSKKSVRSASRDRQRKSRSRERNRRSRSRSHSRRKTPSIDYDRRKKQHKERLTKHNKRSRSRSFTPRHHKPTTPDRRGRSRSKKAKKKKHRDQSKEIPSTLTKEVFTSGKNILVSVNFNNQDDKPSTKSQRTHERDCNEPKDIVDITARKKINISSKPVAIIDLARSPFRELTPEYQSNVIELSDDSDGEKINEKRPPKSPDSTLSSKLYDPFDILNSPPNENVTSSQNNLSKPQEKIQEPVKTNVSYNKNVMAMATNSNFFNEENIVTSSSSLMGHEKQLPLLFTNPAKVDAHHHEKNLTKIDNILPMNIVESPYSPGHEYDDSFTNHEDDGKSPKAKPAKGTSKDGNIFDELFGSSSPLGSKKIKGGKKSDKSTDPNRYLMKQKRQDRVVEEVKLVIKPYYSKRTITKEQYKEILRKSIPKICNSKEINPQKIKVLIDSYVKLFKHRKKRSGADEIL